MNANEYSCYMGHPALNTMHIKEGQAVKSKVVN